MDADNTCKNLPNLYSSFVDTFVDFSVSEIFLPDPPSPPVFQTSYPSPNRLIAIGDLHGDLRKSKQALRLAGLIDSQDQWSGGSSTLVQVGDVLDRGGQELKILYFLEKLKRQAAKVGGNVITMNGNHEIMNVYGDFWCTDPSGLDEFQNWADWFTIGNNMKRLCDGLEKPKDIYDGIPTSFPGVKQEYVNGFRARIAALRPQGPIASRFLSKNMTVLVVGESVFVHGGILPHHVAYGLERINEEVRDWITGLKETVSSDLVMSRSSVVWLRKFSNEVAEDCDCSMLEHVLATIPGARRMIMGHTIQKGGINASCNNKAIRIDVGMSKGCIDGLPEVLEISEDSGLRILTSNPAYDQNRHDLMMRKQHETRPIQDGRSTLRSADILVFGWIEGKHGCVDLTGVSPFVGLGSGSFTAGHAALKAVTCKVVKHENACIKNQHVFVTFAFDTFGFLAPEGVDITKKMPISDENEMVSNSRTIRHKMI